ncbi:MAG: RdgB/HAM1 family non-canonical purine NTP pyrophosphatase [Thermoleophilia bacterium]|nr:RdgB/HAM1 family non-canonical purine NTP pyrophosphatase [Thermoleophilia bacterium]
MGAKTELVLATRNLGKAQEMERMLGGAFRVRPLPEWVDMPPEDGETFADNARLKARAVFRALGGSVAVLADDSGLEVDALGGKPGVYSARYAGQGASDDANVAKLLRELEGHGDRRARFVCALCLILPAAGREACEARVIEVSGTCEGSVACEPRGEGGFGYDPVFIPEGWGITLAEASPADKDRVSHRGAAVRALLGRLCELGIICCGH